jgi:hypothetical protein
MAPANEPPGQTAIQNEPMKRTHPAFFLATLALLCGFSLAIAAARAESSGDTGAADSPRPEAAHDREALEEKLKDTLANATMIGRWCSIRNGELGPEQEDRYTIIAATKVGGDTWLIHTRIQYGERDFVAPLPVQVKWAGDTPVLVVDALAMPGGTRRYSARVLIYGDTYAGTWSGGEHAGLLKGVITRQPK